MATIIITTGTDAKLPGLVALAAQASGDVTALVVGTAQDARAAATSGVTRVVGVILPQGVAAESAAVQVADLVAEAASQLILAPTSGPARVLLAAAAARIGVPLVTGVSEISAAGGVRVVRSVHTGIAEQTEQAPALAVCTDPIVETPAPGGASPVEEMPLAGPCRIMITATKEPAAEAVDLGAAARVVTVGRGLRAAGDLALIRELAAALRAEVACTRPLAEGLDWLPRDRYLGVSGQHIAPAVYLGLGVSGQVQHMVGIRRSGTVVAVNTDRSAPIFAECDYGIVGDLYEVVPALIAALKA